MNTEELNRPVSFPQWNEALASDPEIGPEREDMYRHAIMGYLKHLKNRHQRASLASAKAYFDGEKEAGRDREEAREAVRWFFRTARRDGISNIQQGIPKEEGENGTLNVQRSTFNAQVENAPAVIVPEKTDMGATPWERKLVERLRVGHYQWRTELTYREWARRFHCTKSLHFIAHGLARINTDFFCNL
jgi:hypothetical protein